MKVELNWSWGRKGRWLFYIVCAAFILTGALTGGFHDNNGYHGPGSHVVYGKQRPAEPVEEPIVSRRGK